LCLLSLIISFLYFLSLLQICLFSRVSFFYSSLELFPPSRQTFRRSSCQLSQFTPSFRFIGLSLTIPHFSIPLYSLLYNRTARPTDYFCLYIPIIHIILIIPTSISNRQDARKYAREDCLSQVHLPRYSSHANHLPHLRYRNDWQLRLRNGARRTASQRDTHWYPRHRELPSLPPP
jgi:hypothetical protein